MSTINKITLNTAKNLIPHLLKAKVVPFLHSSPGIGKSSILRQVARNLNLQFIDIRLSDMDPSDIAGLPTFENGRAKFVPYDTFPLDTDTVPEGKDGWLICFDEFNSASQATQAACYKVLLDRMVGQRHLHPKVVMAAAGNLDTDNAITSPMTTALISRFAHFYIELSHKEFMEHVGPRLDVRIMTFLGRFPKHLSTFHPDADSPYACSRTWEKLSDVIKNVGKFEANHVPLAESLIGNVASEFYSYTQLFRELPSIETIMADPETLEISDSLSIRWAIIGMIAHAMNKDNAKELSTYMRRFPRELQMCALSNIKAHSPMLLDTALRSWMLDLHEQINR